MAAQIIFLLTYAVLAIGRLPGFRVDRTGAAIIGASLMVGTGALTLDAAYRAVNWDTILLLFGMMIVVANLQLSGLFSLIAARTVEHVHRPVVLLAAIVLVSGVFSAFFVNDTICLVLTPLVLDITTSLKRNPVPYLLAVAMASNIGSVATITGNPQNMLIGSYSKIPYRQFTAALAPVAAVGLLLAIAVIYIVYRREFRAAERVDIGPRAVRVHRALLWKSLAASAAMIALFFAGWQVPKVAIVTGAVLLITRRIRPERVYRRIDWTLLVMFAGLFIVIAGVENSMLAGDLQRVTARIGIENVFVLSVIAAVLANLVSNVPAVLLFKPLLAHTGDPVRTWLTLAMASTLSGNLTVLGSIANLIVVQQARGSRDIGFWEYFRTGAPLAILTLAFGAAWIQWG